MADPVVSPMLHCPPVETHLMRSAHVAQTYQIQVWQPTQARGETARFPVVYLTDANRVFDLFRCVSELVQVTGYDAPRFILVGIGYPSDSPRAASVLRARDFTFRGYPAFRPEPPPVEGVLLPEEGTPIIHGAEEFRKFLSQELIPFIDASYQTVAGDTTLFGHSGGGGFALYTLFTHPETFLRYIASSPNLTFTGDMDGVRYERCDYLFDDADRFLAAARTIRDRRLYMSVGGEEEFEPPLAGAQLTSAMIRMAQLLRQAKLPGLKIETEIFPTETHMTVWPFAFIHGVQAVFDAGFRRSAESSS